MNKYEDALVTMCYKCHIHNSCKSKNCVPMNILIELVDKATPKKPIIELEEDFDDEGYSYGKEQVPYCSNCNWCLMDNAYNKLAYCPNCQQAINWSDES